MTVQRLVELRGIPTVTITASPDDSVQANPPRALWPREAKPGHSLVRAGDAALQKRILLDALELLVNPAAPPGQIVTRDYPSEPSGA